MDPIPEDLTYNCEEDPMRLLGTIVSCVLSFEILANEVAVQMIDAGDVRAATTPTLTEGIESASRGAIYFPDTIPTANIESLEGNGAAILTSWSESHRFLIAPFSIGVRPEGNRIPKQVDVLLAFEDLGDFRRQPIINDVFPPNGFKRSPFQGEASLKVSSQGGFIHASGVGAEAEAAVEFSYSYTPAYANVVSGSASGHAFWQFSRTQDSYPIGNIPMKLLLIVPRAYEEPQLVAHFDVDVNFDGNFFTGGSVTASFSSIVVLTPE